MLVFSSAFADGDDASLSVKTVSSTASVYEDNFASFEVSAENAASEPVYSWQVTTNELYAQKLDGEMGWYTMGTAYPWASGTDSAKLSMRIPKGYALKYSNTNSLLFRCKVSVGEETVYSEVYPLEILALSYPKALEFDDEYQVPAFSGDSFTTDIAPTESYLTKFAAKALPDNYPSDLYSIKASIRLNGDIAVNSDLDYARLESSYSEGRYLITEVLSLYRNGIKVSEKLREVTLDVQNKCDHDWEKVWSNASCAGEGVSIYTCKKCGASKDVQEAATEEHDWISLSKVPSSCTQDGENVSVCRVCGKIKVEKLEGGHTYVNVLGGSKVCRICKHEYKKGEEDVVEPAPHYEWIEDTESYVAASCMQEGKRIYNCDDLAKSVTVDIPRTECVPGEWEDKSNGDCDSEGKRQIFCKDCGKLLATDVLPAGHDWEVGEVVYPTCSEFGKLTWKCTRCGETSDAVLSTPIGHNIVHVSAADGSCVSAGALEHYICTECGAMFADAEGNTAIGKSEVIGVNDGHYGGSICYDGHYHYTLCACLDKVEPSLHKFSGGVCKVCGYVKGSRAAEEIDFVEKVCEILGVSEIVLLMILGGLFALFFIATLITLIVMLAKKRKAKKAAAQAAEEQLKAEAEKAELAKSGNEVFGEIVDVDDATLIDWGDDDDIPADEEVVAEEISEEVQPVDNAEAEAAADDAQIIEDVLAEVQAIDEIADDAQVIEDVPTVEEPAEDASFIETSAEVIPEDVQPAEEVPAEEPGTDD